MSLSLVPIHSNKPQTITNNDKLKRRFHVCIYVLVHASYINSSARKKQQNPQSLLNLIVLGQKEKKKLLSYSLQIPPPPVSYILVRLRARLLAPLVLLPLATLRPCYCWLRRVELLAQMVSPCCAVSPWPRKGVFTFCVFGGASLPTPMLHTTATTATAIKNHHMPRMP